MKCGQASESSRHLNRCSYPLEPRVYTIATDLHTCVEPFIRFQGPGRNIHWLDSGTPCLLPYVDARTHSSDSKDLAKIYIGQILEPLFSQLPDSQNPGLPFTNVDAWTSNTFVQLQGKTSDRFGSREIWTTVRLYSQILAQFCPRSRGVFEACINLHKSFPGIEAHVDDGSLLCR